MANKKISDLVAAGALGLTDVLEIDTGALSLKITGSQIVTLAQTQFGQNYLPFVSIPSFTPANSTTYFIGGDTVLTNNTVYGNASLVVLKGGTITAAYLKARFTGNGTAEAVAHSIRLNNASDIVLGNGSYNTGVVDLVATGLNQAVAVNDTIAIKLVTPAWVTPPTGVRWFGYVLIV